jgi:ion channel-forming bestrophin family protein
MLNYNPKRWWRIFFSLRGTVIPHVRIRVVCLVILTLLLELFDQNVRKLPELNNLGHTLLGVALSLLIVFRTNTSYDRFWEGRRIWGSIVNGSRNLMRSAVTLSGDRTRIPNLTVAFVIALKLRLRREAETEMLLPYLSREDFQQTAKNDNPPLWLSVKMSESIQHDRRAGTIDAIQANHLEQFVAVLVDGQGACERILRTPIPFIYATHIKQLLFVYLITLPFVLVPVMGWAALAAVGICAFGLLGIEDAGVEIEDPFGRDPNDLPLEDYVNVIARDCAMLSAVPPEVG